MSSHHHPSRLSGTFEGVLNPNAGKQPLLAPDDVSFVGVCLEAALVCVLVACVLVCAVEVVLIRIPTP